ncbi:MAG TPA: methylated-DNA--[protein]-cysteine S-methyltransferase [Acidimicrobiales bacterium]|nr:methylated-DNA--[protein]-cysteine S-methyltransferase [Acidimicrobiales bacterium]
MTIRTTTVEYPLGTFHLAVRGEGRDERVVAVSFDVDHFERLAERVRARFPDEPWEEGGSAAADALRRYVDGDLAALDDVAVDTAGTPFQERVWAALRSIPVGSTWSYADLAAAVGSPGAVRAVGSANGANPVSIVVPCHRVVRSDGSLGGYGGGLDRKSWLLEHEGVIGRLPLDRS